MTFIQRAICGLLFAAAAFGQSDRGTLTGTVADPAGSIGAIRNQMAFVVLSPGVSGSGTGARINGFGGNTFRVMIEGQDTTSGNTQARVDETQASVEAIEEFTLQTSNFAAEFGQSLGGVFNFTIRSGTNRYH